MLHGVRVLVVDDEPLVCEMIAAMLVEDGHCPRAALTGADALRKFDSEDFDVVLADYQMPGMRGDQLAALIKRRLRPKPVILMSGRPMRRHPRHVDLLLQKPFSLLELRVALGQIDAIQNAIAYPKNLAIAA